MKTVKLETNIEDGSVIFTVSESKDVGSMPFSSPSIKKDLRKLYKESYKLNRWRTFDKSVMEKKFGK
jgi:hypothetical protein